MSKVAVIGGGASGLVAAIYASANNKVTILEKNLNCGKKILATGNGKCNYGNIDQNLEHYHSNNEELLGTIITDVALTEISKFFKSLGIIPKIKNGYYYPFSNQASTIRNALFLEAGKRNIQIKTQFLVDDIKKINNKFLVKSKTETLEFDKVIIATGSIASQKPTSDKTGYDFALSFKHQLVKPLPALVQLKLKANYLKEWAGIRTDVIVSLYEDNKKIKEETGEIQLTDYGISGICVFNLSRFVSRGLSVNKKEVVKINFLPFIKSNDITECLEWLEEQNKITNSRTIKELLEGILNDKLVKVILKESNIDNNQRWIDLSKTKKEDLITKLITFTVEVKETNNIMNAQVCTGGVKLSEINTNTMESKKVKNLYFAGEVLDVDGDCGGYNLTFAWITGRQAGLSCVKGDNYD